MYKGQKFSTASGDLIIIEDRGAQDVEVMFVKTGHIKVSSRGHIKRGEVKDPFHPSIHGVGYLGNSSSSDNGGLKRAYVLWRAMLRRCYEPLYLNKNKSYRECEVEDRWKCFELFEKDLPHLDGYKNWLQSVEKYELDKDMKIKGNKIYSSETCQLVPKSVNVSFSTRRK